MSGSRWWWHVLITQLHLRTTGFITISTGQTPVYVLVVQGLKLSRWTIDGATRWFMILWWEVLLWWWLIHGQGKGRLLQFNLYVYFNVLYHSWIFIWLLSLDLYLNHAAALVTRKIYFFVVIRFYCNVNCWLNSLLLLFFGVWSNFKLKTPYQSLWTYWQCWVHNNTKKSFVVN